MGNGIAIPHARTSAVNCARVAVGISKGGFQFDSVDNESCHIIFMIACSKEDGELHLTTLANLSKKLMHDDFIKELMKASTEKEVIKLVSFRGE